MKKSIAFLLASLAATSSLLFHTQEAKAGINEEINEGINDECSIKMPGKLVLNKAMFGSYEGDYVIMAEFSRFQPNPMLNFGKNEKRAKKAFKRYCKNYKN